MAITFTSGEIQISGSKSSGTATSGSSSTLVNSAAPFSSSYRFSVVEITSGTGVGQYRVVRGASTTTLTVANDWDTAPDATSGYVVYYMPEDIVSAVPSNASYTMSSAVPGSITLTDPIRVMSGGYFGYGKTPALVFTGNRDALECNLGGHIQFGDMTSDQAYGINGGAVVVHHDAGSGFNNLDMLGYCRFFGTTFSCTTDFMYGTGIGTTERTRYNLGNPTTNEVIMLDCQFQYVGYATTNGDRLERCQFINTQLETQGLGSASTVAIDNKLLKSVFAFDGGSPSLTTPIRDFTVYDTLSAGNRPDRSLWLYAWLTGDYAHLINYVHDDYADFPDRVYFDVTSSGGVLWFGASVDVSIIDSASSALSGVTIGLFDKNGDDAWVSAFGNPSTFTSYLTTDGSGEVSGDTIIGKIEQDTGTAMKWSAGYPLNPWTIKIRKYDYQFQTLSKTWDRAGIEALSVNDNTVTVLSAAAAAALTNITVVGDTSVTIATTARTMSQVYDYTQSWAASSSGIGYDEAIESADGATYTLNGYNLIISGVDLTGTGTINIGSNQVSLNSSASTTLTLNGGTVNIDTGAVYNISFSGTQTLNYSGATGSAIIDLRGSTISGTVDLTSSTATVTYKLPIGTSYTDTDINVTVEIATVDTGLQFSGLPDDGFQVVVYETGTTTEVYRNNSTTGSTDTWSEVWAADQTVDYTIIKGGYELIRVTGVTATNTVQTINLTVLVDREYQTGVTFNYSTDGDYTPGTGVYTLTKAMTCADYYSAMVDAFLANETNTALKNVAFTLDMTGDSLTFNDATMTDASVEQYLYRGAVRFLSSATLTDQWAGVWSDGDVTGLTAEIQQRIGLPPNRDGWNAPNQASTGEIDCLVKIYEAGVFDYRDTLNIKYQTPGYEEGYVDVYASYGSVALYDRLYVVALQPEIITGLPTSDPGALDIDIIYHATPTTWNGKSWSFTVQDNTGYTGAQIWNYINYNLAQDGTLAGYDVFNLSDMIEADGSKYATKRFTLIGPSAGNLVINAAGDNLLINAVNDELVVYPADPSGLKGVRVVQSDGTTAHPDFSKFQADDGSYYTPPVSIFVRNDNLVAGSKVQLYNVTQATEIEVTTLASTGYVTTLTEGTDYNDGDVLRIRATYYSGTSAKKNYTEQTTAGLTTVSFTGTQSDWTEFTAMGIDPDTVTECTTDFVNVQVDVTDADNSTTKPRIVSFIVKAQTTDDGIRNWFGGLTLIDSANALWDQSIAAINVSNEKAGSTLKIIDDATFRNLDGSPMTATSTYNIVWESGLAAVVETGTSGLTPSESNQLSAISDVDARTTSMETTLDTVNTTTAGLATDLSTLPADVWQSPKAIPKLISVD